MGRKAALSKWKFILKYQICVFKEQMLPSPPDGSVTHPFYNLSLLAVHGDNPQLRTVFVPGRH